jgi:hypothetical protein
MAYLWICPDRGEWLTISSKLAPRQLDSAKLLTIYLMGTWHSVPGGKGIGASLIPVGTHIECSQLLLAAASEHLSSCVPCCSVARA